MPIEVAINDGYLRGRKPPSSLRPYLLTEDWQNLANDIYTALLPAIRFKWLVLWGLAGFLAMPLLSFLILLVFVLSGLVPVQDESEEDAFQLLLLVATGGCLGFGFLVTVLGSLLRRHRIDGIMQDNLARVKDDFLDGREGLSLDVIISPDYNQSVRRAFMAWCDVDFILQVSIESFDDYECLEDTTGTTQS